MASITIQHSHKNLIFASVVANDTGASFKEEGGWITIEDHPRLVIPHYLFTQAFDPEGRRQRQGGSRLDSAWRSLLLNKRGKLLYFGDDEIVIVDEIPEVAKFLLRFPDPEVKAEAEEWADRGAFPSLNAYILDAVARHNLLWEELAKADKAV